VICAEVGKLSFLAAHISSSQPVLSRYSLYPLAGDAAAIGARIPVYFFITKKATVVAILNLF
jgi:hypothetical protein